MGQVYAIPGQHDLALHNYYDLHKSSYWTLVKAGAIQNILPESYVQLDGMNLYGFPWGHEITPVKVDPSIHRPLKVCVAHEYIWRKDCCYPNAPVEKKYSYVAATGRLVGYDVASFGDNHKGFTVHVESEDLIIHNNGGMLNWNSDERHNKPSVGLLYSDGLVERKELDTIKDKWDEEFLNAIKDEPAGNNAMLEQFFDVLDGTLEIGTNFGEIVRRYMDSIKVGSKVRKIVLRMLEDQ